MLARYMELVIKKRQWSIDILGNLQKGVEKERYKRWILQREESCAGPLKLLDDQYRQLLKIKEPCIVKGIKMLTREEALLDACISECPIKNKHDQIQELNEMKDDCDFRDWERAEFFGIADYWLKDMYNSDDDVISNQHPDGNQRLFKKKSNHNSNTDKT